MNFKGLEVVKNVKKRFIFFKKQGGKCFSFASLRKSQKAGLQNSFPPVISLEMGIPLIT
jgi:hypothetical protein